MTMTTNQSNLLNEILSNIAPIHFQTAETGCVDIVFNTTELNETSLKNIAENLLTSHNIDSSNLKIETFTLEKPNYVELYITLM